MLKIRAALSHKNSKKWIFVTTTRFQFFFCSGRYLCSTNIVFETRQGTRRERRPQKAYRKKREFPRKKVLGIRGGGGGQYWHRPRMISVWRKGSKGYFLRLRRDSYSRKNVRARPLTSMSVEFCSSTNICPPLVKKIFPVHESTILRYF